MLNIRSRSAFSPEQSNRLLLETMSHNTSFFPSSFNSNWTKLNNKAPHTRPRCHWIKLKRASHMVTWWGQSQVTKPTKGQKRYRARPRVRDASVKALKRRLFKDVLNSLHGINAHGCGVPVREMDFKTSVSGVTLKVGVSAAKKTALGKCENVLA